MFTSDRLPRRAVSRAFPASGPGAKGKESARPGNSCAKREQSGRGGEVCGRGRAVGAGESRRTLLARCFELETGQLETGTNRSRKNDANGPEFAPLRHSGWPFATRGNTPRPFPRSRSHCNWIELARGKRVGRLPSRITTTGALTRR